MYNGRQREEYCAVFNVSLHFHSLRLNSPLSDTLSTSSFKVTHQIARPHKTSKLMITLRLQMLTLTVPFYLVCLIGKEVGTDSPSISA